jgi:thioesterase domain-containing protein
MLPGVAGHVMAYREFAQLLQIDHPVIGMEMRPELEHNRKARSLEQITAEFVGRMTKIYPSGPFLLAGWSFGGRLAIEASLQLTAAGREVSMVLLFDTYGPGFPRALAPRERVMAHVKNVITLPPAKKLAYLGSRVLASGRLIRHQSRKLAVGPEANFHAYEDPHTREMVAINHAASQAYVPKPFPVKITLIRAERPVPDGMGLRVGVSYDDRYNGWRPFAARGIDLIPLDASHLGLFEQPAVSLVADAVTKIVKSAIPLAVPG